ncbi:MAG: hypothetical protein IH819_01585 [Bacteroidetes bacterium]|nr:hypothetical protein [Bacteroidota bacterium]
MKRLFGALVLTLISFFFVFNSMTIAQDEGHYYTVTTWKLKVPADGSAKELNEQ